jgi:AcrR family transcriptional regulator
MEPEIELQIPKKKEQIIATGEELFQKFGFRRVTVEEICNKASVSKMTFYKYFNNKNDLIKNMLNGFMAQAESAINETKEMKIPFIEKIKLLLKLKYDSSSRFSREMLFDYINPEPELQIFMKEFFDRGTDLFIKFIENAQLKGEVRQGIKPAFLIAVINKLVELAKDPNVTALYPNVLEFSLEINKFLYCGLMPIDEQDSNAVEN